MTKVLVFSDIHNDTRALEKLMNIDADAYICAGDLVSWARGLEKMAPLLAAKAERAYVMPGNHESAKDITEFCARHGFHNFHDATMELGGVRFAGLGYSSPTPFDTPGEWSEVEMAAHLSEFAA